MHFETILLVREGKSVKSIYALPSSMCSGRSGWSAKRSAYPVVSLPFRLCLHLMQAIHAGTGRIPPGALPRPTLKPLSCPPLLSSQQMRTKQPAATFETRLRTPSVETRNARQCSPGDMLARGFLFAGREYHSGSWVGRQQECQVWTTNSSRGLFATRPTRTRASTGNSMATGSRHSALSKGAGSLGSSQLFPSHDIVPSRLCCTSNNDEQHNNSGPA
jgi:hypothetical protein